MKHKIQKYLRVRISELISIFVVIPFILLVQSNMNVNVSVFVAPPEDPVITEIIVHPHLYGYTIKGESIYNTQPVWIEDHSRAQIVEVNTDVDGNFTAVIDSKSKFTRFGSHHIVAHIEIKQDEVIFLESNEVIITIDEDFNLSLDPESKNNIVLSIDNITQEELENLQTQNNFSILPHTQYGAFTKYVNSYKNLSQLYTAYQLIIHLLILLFVLFSMTRRFERKKSSGKPFWSLGKGIYFPQERTF
ncbi:hypothetical protein ACFL0L_01710 [Patescibacteria group bacterium]